MTDLTQYKYNMILYPPTIYKYNVCAFTIIMPCFIGKDILILTMNRSEINKCLPSDLPDNFYISYDSDSNDNNTNSNNKLIKVFNNPNKIIIVDDIKLFQMMELGNLINGNGCRFVFIGTLGLSSNNIQYIESKVSNNKINYHNLSIADIGPMLDYQVNISSDIQSKIKKLITILLLKPGIGRHIIYVNNPDQFMEQCENFLTEFKLKNIVITSENSQEYQDENFGKWIDSSKDPNSSNKYPSIMISSLVPPFNLYNISDIHFFDYYDYFVYRSFIDKIYLKSLYNQPIGKLTVHFHINNNKENQKDIKVNEMNYYRNIKNRLSDEQYIYSHLLKKSTNFI